jgi:hypothetical protein
MSRQLLKEAMQQAARGDWGAVDATLGRMDRQFLMKRLAHHLGQPHPPAGALALAQHIGYERLPRYPDAPEPTAPTVPASLPAPPTGDVCPIRVQRIELDRPEPFLQALTDAPRFRLDVGGSSVAQIWGLRFVDEAPSGVRVFDATQHAEDTQAAQHFARVLLEQLNARHQIGLDFRGLSIGTQSYLHALLFEPLRVAWALRIPMFVLNAEPAVRSGLELLESYALGG